MNRSLKSVLLGGLAAALALSAAACGGKDLTVSAERPWDVLPANVVGVVHIDVKALMRAEMFRSMDEGFQGMANAPLGMFAQFEADTGFNPMTDIDSITMGGIMEGGEGGPYFVVVKGRFDVDRLVSFAENHPDAHDLGLDGISAFETINPSNPMEDTPTIGFLDETTALAASPGDFPYLMKAVAGDIDTVAGTSLAKHAAGASHHVFAVFDIPEDAFATPEAAMFMAMAQPLQQLQTVRIGMNVTDGLDLSVSAMADTKDNAEAVEATLQSFVGMGQMMAAENPEAADMLNSLNLSRSGKTVQISMQISGEQVQTAMQQISPMMLAQALPGASGAFPSFGPTPEIPGTSPGLAPTLDVQAAPAGSVTASDDTDLPANPAPTAGADEVVENVADDAKTASDTDSNPVKIRERRRHGPTVDADDYESAIGSWVRITDTSGMAMKVKLTGVDEEKLTFERRVSGGAMIMSMAREDIASMTLVVST